MRTVIALLDWSVWPILVVAILCAPFSPTIAFSIAALMALSICARYYYYHYYWPGHRKRLALFALALGGLALFVLVDLPQTVPMKALVINALPLDAETKINAVHNLCTGAFAASDWDGIAANCDLTNRSASALEAVKRRSQEVAEQVALHERDVARSPLFRLCLKGSNNPDEVRKSKTACTTYLANLMQDVRFGIVTKQQREEPFCLPSGDLTNDQANLIFERFSADNPLLANPLMFYGVVVGKAIRCFPSN